MVQGTKTKSAIPEKQRTLFLRFTNVVGPGPCVFQKLAPCISAVPCFLHFSGSLSVYKWWASFLLFWLGFQHVIFWWSNVTDGQKCKNLLTDGQTCKNHSYLYCWTINGNFKWLLKLPVLLPMPMVDTAFAHVASAFSSIYGSYTIDVA